MHENHRFFLKAIPLTIGGYFLMAAVLSALGVGAGPWILAVAVVLIAILSLLMGGSDTPPIIPWDWWRSLSGPQRSATACALMWFVFTRDGFGTETVTEWLAALQLGPLVASVVGRGVVFGWMLFTIGVTFLLAGHTFVWLVKAKEALAEKRAREAE